MIVSTSLLTAVLFLTASAIPLTADVIYFHDGNVLLVEKAWIEGDEVKYQTSRGVQTVPRSSVREVQAENLPAPSPSSRKWSLVVDNDAAPRSPVKPAGAPSAPGSEFSNETLRRLRQNLSSNPADAHARSELILALDSVAWLQVTQGDLAGARATLEEALSLNKRDSTIMSNLAYIHLRMSNYSAAENLLRASLDVDRNNQETYYLLGATYYGQEKIGQAIEQWTTGLKLGPHPEMARNLDKAKREVGVHDKLGELRSEHFILRYDRVVSDQFLGQQILSVLEESYSALTRELNSRPPATIAVILYPDQTFFNITRAASWSGAIFDGKIRVPTKGLTGVTPLLRATLRHELTHAFIDALPQDCPAWFNEGVAQMQEGDSAANSKKILAELKQKNRLVPLKDLEKTFAGLPDSQAEIAYAESLSATEFLASRYGRTVIRNILELMGQNYNFDNAFTTVMKQSVAEFERAWHRELAE
jgi:tetratricopeptide (TPR) repeat protein